MRNNATASYNLVGGVSVFANEACNVSLLRESPASCFAKVNEEVKCAIEQDETSKGVGSVMSTRQKKERR